MLRQKTHHSQRELFGIVNSPHPKAREVNKHDFLILFLFETLSQVGNTRQHSTIRFDSAWPGMRIGLIAHNRNKACHIQFIYSSELFARHLFDLIFSTRSSCFIFLLFPKPMYNMLLLSSSSSFFVHVT